MKHICYLLIMFIASSGCRTTKNVVSADQESATEVTQVAQETQQNGVIDFYQPSTWILGNFDGNLLRQPPHSSWFIQGYDSYMPKSDVMKSLLDVPMQDVTIKVVMGTWCSDSRREVPRFIKILDSVHFSSDRITFIGVDSNKNSPSGEAGSLSIERVPTMIFFKNNAEVGRIIEIPEASLEQDMLKILTGMKK